MAQQLQHIYLRSQSKKGRGEQGEMGCVGSLLASRALSFPFQPSHTRSTFIWFILVYLDGLSKILFERM